MVISEPPVSETEKREALETVLSGATFARSAQLRAFLRYVCEREMAGRLEDLTEYQIAVEVLGRRKDFNLADDSSVRNRAYELRQRLEKFYSQEHPGAGIRIEIPHGGYVPFYVRHTASAESPVAEPAPAPGRNWWPIAAAAVLCLVAGALTGSFWSRPHPSAVLREAWGPLAAPNDDVLISIATNFHLVVRPHIPPRAGRYPAPAELDAIYGDNRPRQTGVPLYMEPAQLSVPLAEMAAVATLTNLRQSFGGSYQLLPEAEAPVAALRGRNSILIGTGTNSRAAALLLHNLPYTIDYSRDERFAVIDQRRPAGQNEVFVSDATDGPYGLITVLTDADSTGKPKRTAVFSGGGSAGVQAAAEFFSSPARMSFLKDRLKGFPSAYQVVVRARTSGVRLISYDYVTHEIVRR